MGPLADIPPPRKPDSKFNVGDDVMAFHGNLLFDATITDVASQVEHDKTTYTIHYCGWNESWDRKLDETKVFEANDENRQVAINLLQGATLRPSPITSESGTDKEEVANEDSELKDKTSNFMFQMSATLEKHTLQDYERMTVAKKTLALPRKITVNNILKGWIESQTETTKSAAEDLAEELGTNFDILLPVLLLYEVERKQYNDHFHIGDDDEESKASLPSQVYGAHHLIRFLIKIPSLFETSDGPKDNMETIGGLVNDLARYMHKNSNSFFDEDVAVCGHSGESSSGEDRE